MILPQLRGGFAVAAGERGLVGGVDLAVEPGQIRIGPDRLLHCERRAPAIEARQQIVGIERGAPVAFAARRREILSGFVEPPIEPQRLFVVGDAAVDVALVAVGGAAIVVGKRESRIERNGAIVVGDGAVVVAFVIVGIAAVVEKLGFGPRRIASL